MSASAKIPIKYAREKNAFLSVSRNRGVEELIIVIVDLIT
jgi:hypothetical protein